MDLGGWLRSLGLEKYEAAFRKNQIDETVLPNLTAEDLKDLGVAALGIVVSCSTPSRCCAVMRATQSAACLKHLRHPYSPPKTPPSAAKSR